MGTNEIFASKHDIAALKVKPGHFETAILVLHIDSQFCSLLLGLNVFRSIAFKYLHDSNGENSDAAIYHELCRIHILFLLLV